MKRAAAYLLAVLVAAFWAPPLWGAAVQAPLTSSRNETPSRNNDQRKTTLPQKTSPVLLGGTAIFSIAGLKGATAEERARLIGERVKRLADDLTIPTDAITTDDGDISTDVIAGERIITSLLDSDARVAGVTRQVLAKDNAEKVRKAVEQYRRERAPKSILNGVLLSIAATVVFVALLLLGRALFRRLRKFIEAGEARPSSPKKFDIRRLEQVKVLLRGTVRFLRLFILLVISYIYLHLLLSFFPWTRPFSGQILHHLLVPIVTMEKAVIGYLPNLIFLIVLAVVTYYLLKIMYLFELELEKGSITFSGFYPEWAKPTYKITRFLIIVFVAIVAFPFFPGSQSPAFKGVSIFLGVLLSLGSTSTVSNIIAGLDMTYRRVFLKGDWVKIGDFVGEVTRMRLQVTHMRTFKNEEVVISNSVLLNSNVTNYSSQAREQGLILHTAVTIGYNTPWRQVHAFLLQAAERTPGLLRVPAPFVLQTGLDDFYVRYELNAYTDSPSEMLNIYSNLHQNIQDAFNEFGVQIMSPHYMFDPRSPVVVPKEHWYASPAKKPGEEGAEAS